MFPFCRKCSRRLTKKNCPSSLRKAQGRICRTCFNISNRIPGALRSRDYRRKHSEIYRDYYRDYTREWRKRNKRKVIDHYGGKCACCGEKNIKFLTAHHINNDGAEHRRLVKESGWAMYEWIIAHNYPKIFEVRCYNCNCGAQFNPDNPGVCPHKEGQ